MTRKFNFSAGPATLPLSVLQQIQSELLDWRGSGMSVMEMSHRDKDFMSIAAEAEKDLRELLAVPANYKVLFMQGGAMGQFAAVPMNLLRGKGAADYVVTGSWSTKAVKEVARYAKGNVAAKPAEGKFNHIPARDGWKLDPDAAYVYSPRGMAGSWTRTRPTSTTARTRPSRAWNSTGPRRSARCRWWPTTPPASCRARSTCRASA